MNEAGTWEPRRRARRRALQALYQWQMTGQDTADIMAQFREEQDFGNVDEELFHDLVAGVEAKREELEDCLRPVLDRPLGDCDVMERVILMMGAWQLRHDRSTPRQVVLDECVELAKRFGSAQSSVYVNGVLDKASAKWANSISSA